MSATIEAMKARLAALHPEHLEIIDESALHAGHPGARGGGHYQLTLVSPDFTRLDILARHRLVYQALGELMQGHIHALSITALAPGEL